MINKTTKTALYAKILIETDGLINCFEKDASDKADNVSEEINKEKKLNFLNFQRIRNNAIIMLIRGGAFFYTESSEWNNAKNIYLKINGTIYTLDLQSAKTLLSGEYEKILSKSFSSEEKNNKIELSKADSINFDKYKNISTQIPENTKKGDKNVAEKQLDVKSEEVKPQKENLDLKKKSKDEIVDNGAITNLKQKENLIKKPTRQTKEVVVSDNPIVEVDDFIFSDEPIQIPNDNIPIKLVDTDLEKTAGTSFISKALDDNNHDINMSAQKSTRKIKESKHKILKPEDDIELIDDSIYISEVTPPSPKGDVDHENILVSDLIMDIYTISFNDKEDIDNKKSFTIIVAPADISRVEYSAFAPTFAFAKTGKNVCTCASPNKSRSSYQIILDNETFVIRGKWNAEGFVSLVYPLNTNNKNVTISQKHIKSLTSLAIGHNLTELDNGIKIHVLPLSSTNSQSGNVGILVCLEDPIEDKYACACSRDSHYVEVTNNKITYKISASWVDKRLVSTILII